MKKMISMLLVLVMVLSLFAACGNKNDVDETIPEETQPVTDAPAVDEPAVDEPAVDAPAVDAPASSGALAVLDAVWAATEEHEKFPAMGGDANNMVDGAPGVFGLNDAEMLTFQLLVPAEQVQNIDDAAALFHGMMLNNFTCGVFHVTGDVKEFADAMYDAIKNNQWMCGFPETMAIITVDGEYVVAAFGLEEIMKPFTANVKEAHPEAEALYLEAIA